LKTTVEDGHGYRYNEIYFNGLFASISWIKDFTGTSLVGIGGTFKNLRKIYTSYNDDWFIHQSPLTSMPPFKIKDLCNHIKTLSLKDREKLKGLSKKRADIILGGCELITNMINYCDFAEIKLCDEGLRAGILANYLNKQNPM